MDDIVITREIAQKCLDTVDAGLVQGKGQPIPGHMCVEAAVCYAMGLPHGDNPTCVSPALRALKIRLNDSCWSSNKARAAGLRRLALVQLGSKGALNELEFVQRLAPLVKEATSAYADAAAAYADAADAAYAAAYADAAYADAVLNKFAEGVVQILIDMKVSGVQWLSLTEV